MSATVLDGVESSTRRPQSACTALPLVCSNCESRFDAEPSAICLQCLGPLVPEYDATRTLPGREEIARRAPSLWRYREWLPFTGTPSLSLDSGFTPLVEAPERDALAELLADHLPQRPRGVARRSVEVDVGVPAFDRLHVERRHPWIVR